MYIKKKLKNITKSKKADAGYHSLCTQGLKIQPKADRKCDRDFLKSVWERE